MLGFVQWGSAILPMIVLSGLFGRYKIPDFEVMYG